MALGNIQWRFQEPVDLHSQINRLADRKAKMWAEMGKSLGGAIQGFHDMKLDEELAQMMEGYDKANGEQLASETKLINEEIEKLQKQQSQLVAEVEQLKVQKEQIMNPVFNTAKNDGFGFENYAGRDAGFGGN